MSFQQECSHCLCKDQITKMHRCTGKICDDNWTIYQNYICQDCYNTKNKKVCIEENSPVPQKQVYNTTSSYNTTLSYKFHSQINREKFSFLLGIVVGIVLYRCSL